MNRDEIVQKQAEVVAEAAEIQKDMEKINGLSELAKSRIAEGLKTAERAAGSLERGDSKDAADAAGKASEMFRELARNVEGLAAAETSKNRHRAMKNFRKPNDLPMPLTGSRTSSNKPAPGRKNREGRGELRRLRIESWPPRPSNQAGKTDWTFKRTRRSEAIRQVQDLMQQGKLGETVKQRRTGALARRPMREASSAVRDRRPLRRHISSSSAASFDQAPHRRDGTEREAVELQKTIVWRRRQIPAGIARHNCSTIDSGGSPKNARKLVEAILNRRAPTGSLKPGLGAADAAPAGLLSHGPQCGSDLHSIIQG